MPQQAEKIEQNEQTEIWMRALDTALPLYTRAIFPKLRACVEDVLAGGDLSNAVKGKSSDWVLYAADAALKAGKIADQALMAELDELVVMPFDGMDDFSLATLAQVLFERNSDHESRELSDRMASRNTEALLQILFSKEGSPLLYYDWIASDLVQYQLVTEDFDELEILKMSLAHTMLYGEADQIIPILRHIGVLHLECDEIARGCRVFGELIASDPLDFENYYDVSLLLGNLKHYDLSQKAAKRAHHMLRITGSKHDMADHLAFYTEMNRQHALKEDARIDKTAEAPLRNSLEIGSMRGTRLSIDELVKRIVPEIDTVLVKKMPLWCSQNSFSGNGRC